MAITNEFEFNAEQIVPVRAHQVYAINFHLNAAVAEFDKQCENMGWAGTARHASERMEFARLLAKDLSNLFTDNPNDITHIKTDTTREMSGIGGINVVSESTFE